MTLHVDQMSISRENGQIIVHIPMTLKVRGGRKEIILPDGLAPEGTPAEKTAVQLPLVIAVARAFRWKAFIESGRYRSIDDLARAVNMDSSYVGRILRLTLLAPDIIMKIHEGQEPSGLSLGMLTKALPLDWVEQREWLGM
jgi:hypothetical protein